MNGMDNVKAPVKAEFSSPAQVLQSVNDRLMKKPTLAEVEQKKFSTNNDAKMKYQSAQSSAM